MPAATPSRPIDALLLRLALVINVSLALGYVGLWTMTALKGEFWRGDFTAYYTGWSLLRDGHGDRLYDLDLQTRYQQALLDEGCFKGGLLPYINPPHAAVPFVPLALLPRTAAFWLWTAGQCVLLVWFLRLLLRVADTWKPLERLLLISAVCAFPPLFYTSMLGTFSLWMSVCVVQVYLTLKRGHATRTGLWLALGTVKPQLLLMPGVLALGARRWRVLASGAGFLALMVAASLVFPGWRSWVGFVSIVRTIGNAFDTLGNVPSVMYNVKGTLTLLLGSEQRVLINLVSLALLVLAAGAVLLVWRGPWQPEAPAFELKVALTILAGLLFGPHLNPHDGLLLVIPAALFAAYLRQCERPRRAFAAFVLCCPLLFLVAEFTVGGSLGIRLPVVAMLVLLVWMGKELVWANGG